MLTDNEIKKALECLAHCKECSETEDCQYYMENENLCDNISLAKNALDLINRLQAENERLNNLCQEQNTEIKRLIEIKNRLLYNLKAVCEEMECKE